MSEFLREETPRNEGDQERSRARRTRRPWPGSAKFAVGTMVVLNVVMGAFLVRTELKSPVPAKKHPSATIGVPGVQPSSELNPPPEQATKLDTTPAPAQAVAAPEASTPKPPAIAARRPKTTLSSVAPKSSSQISKERVSGSQNTTYAHDSASIPAVSYPPPNVASIRTPAVGVPERAEQPRQLLAPPAVGIGSSSPQKQSNAAPKTVSRVVAPVHLPGVDKGWVPKMAVGPVSPKMEIIPRPPGEKPENCGDEKRYIPCPTLHTRP